jgi:cellulose synthase (UDP-forming)
MVLFFPQRIYPHNYLPILPAFAATLFVFPMLSRGWRPTIYRLCVINSCCHVYAVWYAVRGRVAEWIPTGASLDSGQVPVKVNRILCTWILLVQVLLWGGLALRVHEYGWHPFWATELLAGVQLYMLAPLLTPSKGVWRRPSAPAPEAVAGGRS